MKNGQSDEHANRLAREKSPYLLQHASNPIEWFAWDEEAFDTAKREDKPVFLSIGYSACHWCHVMEKESFEDEKVATVLNKVFVCIKVDREERPDLDNFYMDICELLTGSGGWPLTILMTPERRVFFAGTYISRESHYGRPGIIELAEQVEDIWQHRRNDILSITKKIESNLECNSETSDVAELGKDVLDDGYEKLVLNFDEKFGGWGHGLKFPSAVNVMFLLRYWRRNMSSSGLKMVEKTLQNMRAGGIFDQVGFGFHRYSTDEEWVVPHFEKMLYDQALLTLAYLEAYQVTKRVEYKRTVEEILEYVLRDLASSEGGFYSSQDADSEGTEGKFYLWTIDQIKQALPTNLDFALKVFGVTSGSNFKIGASEGVVGVNILHLNGSFQSLASDLMMSTEGFASKLHKVCEDLFIIREKRVHPSVDDKILTDWNGLTIAALARAFQVLGEQKYLVAAINATDFVLNKMRKDGKRVFHRFAKGEVSVEGFLDDYAFFIWGLIEIYEAVFDVRYLRAALDLAAVMHSKFWDEDRGGFYNTSVERQEKGTLRKKELFDRAVPSGNSVALLNLLRLAKLTDNMELEKTAKNSARVFSSKIRERPDAYLFALVALDFILRTSYKVVLVGEPLRKDTIDMLAALRENFAPNIVLLFNPAHEESRNPLAVSQWAIPYKELEGKATVYVCRNQTCLPPTNNIADVLKTLKEN